jgi:hypothetical protein
MEVLFGIGFLIIIILQSVSIVQQSRITDAAKLASERSASAEISGNRMLANLSIVDSRVDTVSKKVHDISKSLTPETVMEPCPRCGTPNKVMKTNDPPLIQSIKEAVSVKKR